MCRQRIFLENPKLLQLQQAKLQQEQARAAAAAAAHEAAAVRALAAAMAAAAVDAVIKRHERQQEQREHARAAAAAAAEIAAAAVAAVVKRHQARGAAAAADSVAVAVASIKAPAASPATACQVVKVLVVADEELVAPQQEECVDILLQAGSAFVLTAPEVASGCCEELDGCQSPSRSASCCGGDLPIGGASLCGCELPSSCTVAPLAYGLMNCSDCRPWSPEIQPAEEQLPAVVVAALAPACSPQGASAAPSKRKWLSRARKAVAGALRRGGAAVRSCCAVNGSAVIEC